MMNIPPQRDDTIELNSKQVRNVAIGVIEPQFGMQVNVNNLSSSHISHYRVV